MSDGASLPNSRAKVTIEFQSWWLTSTGGAGGGDFDDVARRDASGCPSLPMSTLRGRLREAAEALAAKNACGWDVELFNALFGLRDADGSGALLFPGEARLPIELRAAFREDPLARAQLYSGQKHTAIDPRNGTAKARALRSHEVCAPMTLSGVVGFEPSRSAEYEVAEAARAHWIELLDAAAAFTLSLARGKNDGLGRAIVSIEPEDSGCESDVPKALVRSLQVLVLITQTEKAVFSARSATEGLHETLDHVPGASLLGWAARSYADYDDAFAVFHSAKLRFGNALPLDQKGKVAFPTPRVLRESKVRRDGVDRKTGQLRAKNIVVRRVTGDEQRETIKARWVTSSGSVVPSRTALDLRTAMEGGRPKANALFGYASIDASPESPRRYAALIEREADVKDADWRRVLKGFEAEGLLLGRAAGAGHGGRFDSALQAADGALAFWPPAPSPHKGRVVVWALSDLALVDDDGGPVLRPRPSDLGLGDGALVDGLSSIAARRYAPWVGVLGSRDIERAVIAAGSVMVFEIDKPSTQWSAVLGLHREVGLGRIWIDPPLLEALRTASAEPHPTTSEGAGPRVEMKSRERVKAAGDDPLLTWARTKARRASARVGAFELAETWWAEAEKFYDAHPWGGPSKAQWRDVALAARDSESIAELKNRLFNGATPVCGRAGQATRVGDWGKAGWLEAEKPVTFRAWLEGKLATLENGRVGLARSVLDGLARRAPSDRGER